MLRIGSFSRKQTLPKSLRVIFCQKSIAFTVVPRFKRLVGGVKSVLYIESLLNRGLLNRGTTVDVGGGEAARENATGNKIHEDEGKLVREGKDGIDHFLEDTVKVPAEDLVGSILQMKGFSGEFSSVHLNDPLGYGAVPQCKIYIPRDIYALGPFIDSLANLISMVEEMEEMASLLIQAYSFFEDRRSSFGPFVGRASSGNQDRTENYSLWRAGTYYFPKKYIRKISVVPEMTN
ncbi:hypothetical protein PS15m_012014 [Mucor circinelloides]